MDEELIDQIYEAAFVPDLWPTVLDAMARIANARGGYILSANPDIDCWTASETLRQALGVVVDEGWLMRGKRFGRLAAARRAGFLTERELFNDGELETDPFYRDLLRPVGLGWAAGNLLPLPTGDSVIFAVERAYKHGPIEAEVVDRLNALYPHLARSVLMAARLRLQRARAATQTLALIGLPGLVFGAKGKVLAANRLIEALEEHVVWRAQDEFSLHDRTANSQLQNAMTALHLDHDASTRSFAIRDQGGQAALVAHVIPVRGESRDILSQCAGVLVLTPVSQPREPPTELVMSLFDLTPAEARVARRLTAGDTLNDIASDLGVSRNTTRSHLRGALAKTGCSRQGQLTALLSGLPRIS